MYRSAPGRDGNFPCFWFRGHLGTDSDMTIGGSIFLIALGAILTYAVDWQLSGVDLDMVGIILMIVGAIGLIVSMFIYASRGRGTRGAVVREQYVDREVV